MAEKVIITDYPDGTRVMSNLRNLKGVPVFGKNETYTATKVSDWYNGDPMTPDKADGLIYMRQKGTGDYYKVNLPNDKELFLEKDTMAQMRDLSPAEILLLKMGYYKGVKLNGYYEMGDTPGSIEYYISNTARIDDGGSVIQMGDLKLEHDFSNGADIRYFGAKESSGFINNQYLLKCLDYCKLKKVSTFVPENRVFEILLEKGSAFYTYTGVPGISITGGGTFKDIQTYNTSPIERSNFMVFKGSSNITLDLKVVGKLIDVNRPTTSVEGQTFFRFDSACENISLNIEGLGCKTLVEFFAEYDASDLTKLDIKNKNISGKINANNCRYGLHSAWGTYNMSIDLITIGCGRSYFLIGSSLINLSCNSTNQKSTSLIKSYYGRGVKDLNLNHVDINSDSSSLANELIAIHYGDETPAVMENINININVKNPTNGWGNTLGIFKYIGGGGTADTVGRGHILKNFSLNGSMEGRTGTQHLVTNVGQFNTPDVIQDVNINNLVLKGGISFNFNTNNIGENIVFDRVYSDFNVYSNNRTVFKTCEAGSFTSATTSEVVHMYDNCIIKNGSLQNYNNNKTFFNTKVPSGADRNVLKKIGTKFNTQSSFRRDGDITQSGVAFTIPYNTQGLYILRYYLVEDATQTNPTLRRETFGAKSFSLSVNTSGVPVILAPVLDVYAERFIGTEPSVLSISFANNGSSVDIICSGSLYNSVNGRMVLSIEVMQSGTNYIDIN